MERAERPGAKDARRITIRSPRPPSRNLQQLLKVSTDPIVPSLNVRRGRWAVSVVVSPWETGRYQGTVSCRPTLLRRRNRQSPRRMKLDLNDLDIRLNLIRRRAPTLDLVTPGWLLRPSE